VVNPAKPLGRSVRAFIASLAVALLGALALAPASEALPGKFWGIVPQGLPTSESFARMKRGGVDSVRVPIHWASVQPAAGTAPNWSGVDGAVASAAAVGLDVLPFVYGAPAWAVPSVPVPGSGGSFRAPRGLPVSGAGRTGWTAFLQLAVQRYGPNGTFWAENPGLVPRPIRTWQIWNEENFKYFVVHPNPVEYGKLVKLSYGAIKSIDPGAKIILGGMFARPKEALFKGKPPQAYFAAEFLDLMYKRMPGIKSKFDGVALHPYTSKYQYLLPEIEEVRAVMEAHGDIGTGFWITELGWSSGKPQRGNSFAKGRSGQVRELKGAFSTLRQQASKWRLKGVYWFSFEDAPGACNFCDGSGLFTELLAPKPSWRAYVSFAGGSAG
jgi:polysaccharide biosynthesis protein PslG